MAVPGDYRVKLKENEKKKKVPGPCLGTEKTVKH